MKKKLCLLLAVLTLLMCFSGLTVHAATGTLTATESTKSVTVGSTVKITLQYNGNGAKIASLDAQLSYNSKAFEYVSCSNTVTANGGAGIVRMSYFATGTEGPASIKVELTFKAIGAGAGNFSVTTSEFLNDADGTSLGTPSKTLSVSAINPTKSANANLASIKPSSGTLTPKFSPSVTSYTISVPYTTTSLSLSVTTQDKGATTAVSGKNALAVGKNTQVITVTAPNGTTKKYTVVINRSANQTTTASGSGTTTSTTTVPQEDPLEVEVDGKTMTVLDTQTSATLPNGYAWTHITINDINVSAAVNEKTNITLVYLVAAQEESGAFYLYDENDETFSRFRPLAVSGGDYVLREMPAGLIPPTGAVKGTYTLGAEELSVYQFEDSALEDIVLIYATSPAGKTGLFMYDVTDGSMQLFREITVAADSAPQPTEPAQNGAVEGFIAQHRQTILIGAAVLGGVALLIAAIVLLILVTRKDKGCKH